MSTVKEIQLSIVEEILKRYTTTDTVPEQGMRRMKYRDVAKIIYHELLKGKQAEIDELREALEFYAHDEMFKQIYKVFPLFGRRARKVLEKYK